MEAGPKTAKVPLDTQNNRYFAVPIHTYVAGETIERSLYFLHDDQHILFQEQGRRWSTEDSTKLSNLGVTELYVKFDSPAQWHSFMDERMKRLLSKPEMTISEKARMIFLTSVSSAHELFHNPESSHAAQRSVSFVKHCLHYLNQDKRAFIDLFSASAQNMSEHCHGFHVSTYSLTLAKYLGYQNEADLLSLGVGAVLHDIGKTKISREVLDKPNSLSEEERRIIQKHPTYSFQILQAFESVSDLSRTIALDHHERIDGSGYPSGKKNIHVFSQIVGLADVFDAMTSDRPYRKQMPSVNSLHEILRLNKGGFDKKLIIAFIEMMKE